MVKPVSKGPTRSVEMEVFPKSLLLEKPLNNLADYVIQGMGVVRATDL
jgi:hypothetical protein